MIPIEHTREWEVGIRRDRICIVPHQHVDPGAIRTLVKPAWVQIADDCSTIDEVSIVEVMIVIVGIAKVAYRLTRRIATG